MDLEMFLRNAMMYRATVTGVIPSFFKTHLSLVTNWYKKTKLLGALYIFRL